MSESELLDLVMVGVCRHSVNWSYKKEITLPHLQMLQFQPTGLEMGLYNYLPLPIKNKGKIVRCNGNPFIILIIKPHTAAARPSTSGWQLENDPRTGERVVRDQDGTSQRIRGELVRLRGQEEEERRGTGRTLREALECVE